MNKINRRKFIQLGAAAGAGLLFHQRALAQSGGGGKVFIPLISNGSSGSTTNDPPRRRVSGADRFKAAQRLRKLGYSPSAAAALAIPQGGTPDYNGMSNWANSPMPVGPVGVLQIVDGGSGYSIPGGTTTITIDDVFGTGSGATVLSWVVDGTGMITSITLDQPGTNYTAPIVVVSDAVQAADPNAVPAIILATIVPAGGGIRKFVDSLPGLNAAGANNRGSYIPVGIPDTNTFPGSDYYEIELSEYQYSFHSDLKPSTLRGYRQTNTADPNVSGHHFLGPVIAASKDVPVRIKFTNALPTGAGGNLFIPCDTTEMGAGMGPLGMNVTPGNPMNYTQNRATLHLHGGRNPWISDGTPHQWITPANELTDYPKGVSVVNVPDMWFDPVTHAIVPAGTPGATNDPGPGSMTFFYSNQQSARLMFYHDHAYGITRLNVYTGEAAGYLLTDATEQSLVSSGVLPADTIPLVFADRTFIDPATVLKTDPTWPFPVDVNMNNLWYPHVYLPNQNPEALDGINPYGRWDYGPWFWPPWPVNVLPKSNPYYDPTNAPWEPSKIPGVPDLSMTMEAFNDTMTINGQAYPKLTVDPKAYRFRILNASNDRFLNLQIHQAQATGDVWTGSTLNNSGLSGEIHTVPFDKSRAWPAGWPTPDLRDGGIPDPAFLGPNIIQIGTEGGFLPAPAIWKNIPLGYDRDPKSITVGNVKEHNLFLGPAERADIIIDFSAFAGQTLILYNDAPAAVPAADARLDYFTGKPDLTDTGGTPTTYPGYGPNIRTVLQIQVNGGTGVQYNLTALQNALKTMNGVQGAYSASQHWPLVPQAGYNSAFAAAFPSDFSAYARISDTSLTFKPITGINGTGATVAATAMTMQFQPKCIAEEFENEYGRMTAFLGVEVPFTNGQNQTTIFYDYMDPSSEVLPNMVDLTLPVGSLGDGTQIWKITHNGVDTHPVHFHLFDVQLINRVDWAGVVKPPEPNEWGWKETVRMNPLEDCIVALRPSIPTNMPFVLPNSYRPLDPIMPLGTTAQFKGVDTIGNPVTVTNVIANFGHEYVWHCHILSHEEMDMMRPVMVAVAPTAPTNLVVTQKGTYSFLTWNNPLAKSFTGLIVQRASNSTFTSNLVQWSLGLVNNYTDVTYKSSGIPYYYRVIALNTVGSGVPGYPTSTVQSAPSNVYGPPVGVTTLAPIALQSVRGAPVVLNWTYAPPGDANGFTIQRATDAAFTKGVTNFKVGVVSTYSDTSIKSLTTYYYRVMATNVLGNGTWSNIQSILTK